MSSSSPEDRLSTALAITIVELAIVALIIVAWFVVKACALVVRVWIAHPRNKPLRVATGCFLLFATAAAFTGGRDALLNALAAGSLVILLVVARSVEIYFDDMLMREVSPASLPDRVLRQPWWALETA